MRLINEKEKMERDARKIDHMEVRYYEGKTEGQRGKGRKLRRGV